MSLFHHYHHSHIYKFLHSSFKLFEVSIWLHVFGRSLISVFIPILLLEKGFSLSQVMIYYLIYNVIDVPLNLVARAVTVKIGAKLTIIIATIFSILFFIALSVLTAGQWSLLITIALFAAIYDTLYWVAHVYFFMQVEKGKNHVTKDITAIEIVRKVAGILAPAFGALVLILSNDQILLWVGAGILLLSIIPLLQIKDVQDKPKSKPLKLKEFFNSAVRPKDYIAISLFALHRVAENIMWPIFIYIALESIESVAIVPIIVSVTTMIFLFLSGKIKEAARWKFIGIASVLIAIMWILRLTIDLPIFYYISVFFVGIFAIFVAIPLNSNIYEIGKRVDPLTTSTYRNIASMTPRIALFGILAVLANAFQASFLTAIMALFVIMIMAFTIHPGKQEALFDKGE